MSLHQTLQFFVKYKYQAIFPVAVVEGPIIALVSGFLVSRGYLAWLPTLIIVFLGDVISDSAFYFLGKGGRKMMPYLKFIKVPPEHLEKLENQFKNAPWQTMIVAKASYGLGTVFMVASGASRMPVLDFMKYMLSLNFIRSAIMLVIGFYFGRAVVNLGPTYLHYYFLAVIVILPLGYLLYKRYQNHDIV